MDSVINNSLRGLVYLAGLLTSCFIGVMVSRSIEPFFHNTNATIEPTNYDCNVLTLGENGPISKLPLSINIFVYTLSYLLVLIKDVDTDNSGLMLKNIPMILLFVLLILADLAWNFINRCMKNPMLGIVSGLIGAAIGVGWASVLTSHHLTDFYYISGTSSKEVCSIPTQKVFKCKKASG
jgi:hypothetical protein